MGRLYEDIASGLARALSSLPDYAPGLIDDPRATLARPNDVRLGDICSNVALRLAKPLKMKPLDLAIKLAEAFDGPARAVAAAPGFLNFTITPERLREELAAVGEADWAASTDGAGRRVNIEYVSANPTGPLHVGHGRGAVIGDVLARLLGNCGYAVTREYYLNDIGKQIEGLGESVLARARVQAGLDAGGWTVAYAGAYIQEVAAAYRAAGLPAEAKPHAASLANASDFARKKLMQEILDLLGRAGIAFDTVTAESTYVDKVAGLIEDYRRRGLLYEADFAEGTEEAKRREDSKAAKHREEMQGGTFLRTTRFGDEIDRIILRRSGASTYFTTDILYHVDKFRRGFDRVIDVWGADHGGHVRRMRAALAAAGLDGERLEIVLCQMVRLLRNGQEVKMSKRTGEMISLAELFDEVGVDAARFFFLVRTPSAQCDFDLDVAVKQSAENPVYYCQYAYARTRQLLKKGEESGLGPSVAAIERLVHPAEVAILRQMAQLPEIVRLAALRLEPHHLPAAAMELAQVFHRYQTQGKEEAALRIVRPEEPETSSARLFLVARVGDAMRRLLGLMGVSAPERM